MVWQGTIIGLLLLAIIPATIAARKGKKFSNWYVYGLLFPVALIHAWKLPKLYESPFNTLRGVINSVNTEESCFYLDCPVELVDYWIREEKQTTDIHCYMKFANLSDRTITELDCTVLCYDAFQIPVSEENAIRVIMEDLSVPPHHYFYSDRFVNLNERPETRKIEVIINTIVFEEEEEEKEEEYEKEEGYKEEEGYEEKGEEEGFEGFEETWESTNSELGLWRGTKVIDPVESHFLKEIAGKDAVSFPEVFDQVWQCVCGRLNSFEDSHCRRCRRYAEDIFIAFEHIQQDVANRIERAEKKRERRAAIIVISVIGLLITDVGKLSHNQARFDTPSFAEQIARSPKPNSVAVNKMILDLNDESKIKSGEAKKIVDGEIYNSQIFLGTLMANNQGSQEVRDIDAGLDYYTKVTLQGYEKMLEYYQCSDRSSQSSQQLRNQANALILQGADGVYAYENKLNQLYKKYNDPNQTRNVYQFDSKDVKPEPGKD